jgi:2-iminobutanoate/2-iminopropanoate deaminase
MADVIVPGRTPGGHYSFATTHNGFVFTAGHLPIPPDGPGTANADFDDQVSQVFDNLFATLAAAGAQRMDILQVTIYLVGVERWPRLNALFADIFGNHRPARTVVPVPELHYGYLLEVEAVAIAAA